jgi:hypothetical protein
MGQVNEYVRSYIDEGRLRNLIWFSLASYGIAFVEWSLSPGIAHLWLPPLRISDGLYFYILFGLSFAWMCVVGVGIKKCGWPGLLMLTSAQYGLVPFYLIAFIYWACMFQGDCL